MRLVRYRAPEGSVRTGVLAGSRVVDLRGALQGQPGVSPGELAACGDTVSLISLGERATALMAMALEAGSPALDGAALRAPIEPRLILCSGENYWDHRDEKPPVDGREPEFFLKNPLGVVAPGEAIRLDPRVTRKLDYEVELAVVIGRPGRHIPLERALDHVFGYTIMNDVTARDRQVRLRPDGTSAYALGPGKSFDTCAPIGPCIVTRDEIEDPQALGIRSFVRGELRQDNNTARMIWSVAQLVAFFSTYITLQPGVLISTGTPGGTGWGSDPELGARGKDGRPVAAALRYLAAGDDVVCEIERIGALRNVVETA
jgi:2-keto-4-pentenoate hydratase/2-oxohepta-3-ene-1,7-dioic acid hydratase in catechol pathway